VREDPPVLRGYLTELMLRAVTGREGLELEE
jgi:hypothetical protein